MESHVEEDGIEQLPSNILKINVNSLRETPPQGCIQVFLLLVTECLIKSKFVLQEIDLLFATGTANNIATSQLCKLPNQLAHSSRCCRNKHTFSFLRSSDLIETSIRCHSWHAKYPSIVGKRNISMLDLKEKLWR
uniref:Uncharacterized protein n=1 Tax=Opuntia streptacantha TaxID=393608 RepID=A0A7C9DX04_OPUST